MSINREIEDDLRDMRRESKMTAEPKVRSAPLVDGKPVGGGASANQLIAIVLWLLACVTTWQLVASVTQGAVWYFQVGMGTLLQAIFTVLERPILRGRPNRVSSAVLIIDTLVNAGGIFPYAMRMGDTPTTQMISTTFNMSPQMTPLAAFAISLIVGFLLAAAPEATWRWRG